MPNEIPKTDHLLLLVGGNPLPIAVAGRLLVRDSGKITLIHTNGTKSIAERLKIWFTKQTLNKDAIILRETDRTNRHKIYKTIESAIREREADVGLHYTGGTAAMAVHAHAAVTERAKEPTFSYLDASTLCIRFDDGTSHYAGRTEAFSISIEDIFLLHDMPLQKKKDGSTVHNKVLPKIEGDQKGDSFEKEVGNAMLPLLTQGHVDEMWMNVQAQLPSLDEQKWPEFDVIALRGYQLYFISCATTAERGKLKQKLFESFVRGRQLGGDEACIALACLRNDPSLELEAQQTLQVEGRVRVFGGKHLPKLSQHFSNWIKTQSREGQPCQ